MTALLFVLVVFEFADATALVFVLVVIVLVFVVELVARVVVHAMQWRGVVEAREGEKEVAPLSLLLVRVLWYSWSYSYLVSVYRCHRRQLRLFSRLSKSYRSDHFLWCLLYFCFLARRVAIYYLIGRCSRTKLPKKKG